MAPAGVRLWINPARDERFVRMVDTALATADDLHDLQAALRAIHPDAVVRESLVSGLGPTWYVYRDGTWVDEQD